MTRTTKSKSAKAAPGKNLGVVRGRARERALAAGGRAHLTQPETRVRFVFFEGSVDDLGALFDDRECRVCGCTSAQACPGGCHWVRDDLCSSCAPASRRRAPSSCGRIG